MNDVTVKPLKPTELQEHITELELSIERLQGANQKAWRRVSELETSLAFMVNKYHTADRMYDALYEKAVDAAFACDEHRKENLEELKRYLD